jgi:hypothetical protein
MIRSLQYYHAALWSAGAWTVRETAKPVEQLNRLLAFVEEEVDDD